MRTALEAAVLIIAFTAINMAMIALYDLLAGPMSWWRKSGWSLLVLSLPLVGAVLYYWFGSERAPQRRRQTKPTHKERG